MAETKAHLKVRQGLLANLDAALVAGEFGFVTDALDIYIGSVTGNKKISGVAEWVHLSGQDQAVKTTGSPTFTTINIVDGAVIGPQVLASTIIGLNAGHLGIATGIQNIIVGENAGHNLTTGFNNSIFGAYAAYSITTARYTCAFGQTALTSLLTGDGNGAFGDAALHGVTTGTYNNGLGDNSLFYLTTGNFMIGIGYNAGYGLNPLNSPVADSDGILIGKHTGRSVVSATILTNYIAIGSNVLIDASNQCKIGNVLITDTRLYGLVGIGGAPAGYGLNLYGGSLNIQGGYVLSFGSGDAEISAPAADILFRSWNGAMVNEKMRIKSVTGNVGINKAEPMAKFAVVGLNSYATDALAGAAGLTSGDFYNVLGTTPLQLAIKI